MKKRCLLLSIIVCLLICATGCGKTKKVDGYYTVSYESKRSADRYYGLEIKGSDVIYYSNVHYWFEDGIESLGYVEYEDGVACIYLNNNDQANYTQFCPLYAKPSDDGTRLYLSSDSPDWSTDIFDKVSESEFRDFISENILN